jgi:hypothetical protein
VEKKGLATVAYKSRTLTALYNFWGGWFSPPPFFILCLVRLDNCAQAIAETARQTAAQKRVKGTVSQDFVLLVFASINPIYCWSLINRMKPTFFKSKDMVWEYFPSNCFAGYFL